MVVFDSFFTESLHSSELHHSEATKAKQQNRDRKSGRGKKNQKPLQVPVCANARESHTP